MKLRPTSIVRSLALGLVAAAFATACTAQPLAECRRPIALGRGPVGFFVPQTYDPAKPTPLIVLLHPFASNGATHERYMRLKERARERNFIVAYPDGTVDRNGDRFWNATDACCDRFGSEVDDVAYLSSLVEALESQCNIDPRRIYFGGLSNGGFMSHRMACERADKVTAIASTAGATFDERNDCRPSEPVHVLQVHGTADDVIFYGGGRIFGLPQFPSAQRTARHWARNNGCSIQPEDDPRAFDFDSLVPQAESGIERYQRSCTPAGSVELWTLIGSGHVPAINEAFRNRWVDYLLTHRKPLTCTEKETIRRTVCRPNGEAIVHLKGGRGAARYTAQVDPAGPVASGLLKPKGAARVVLPGRLEPGEHELTVRWDCGAENSTTIVCP